MDFKKYLREKHTPWDFRDGLDSSTERPEMSGLRPIEVVLQVIFKPPFVFDPAAYLIPAMTEGHP